MAKSSTLMSIEQRDVEFYGDALTAVRADDGQIYVSLDHMCNALGITTAPQTRRIKRNNVLGSGYVQLAIYTTNSVGAKFKECLSSLTEWHQAQMHEQPKLL